MTGFNTIPPLALLVNVIRPALGRLGMGGVAAEQLMLGTAIAESRLHYRQQVNGPALGLWQMEPKTFWDIVDNFLTARPELLREVSGLLGEGVPLDPERLVNDDLFACAMARLQYHRAPEALPQPSDIEGLARYWKQHYNTPLGAGTIVHYLQAWHEVMG